MGYELPPLPYAYDALAPHISKETLEFHHDKHHAAYVTKYNDMVKSAGMDDKSIEEVIKATYNDSSKTGLFNNGAQAWNHTFFWNGMKPGGGGAPTGAVADKINSDLGGYEKFKEQFSNAAATQFGSGWAWLVLDNGTLKIINSPNAVNPIALGHTPLLTLDVWEHAYYLDYQNKRPAFIDTFINNLINWDFVNENMKG
jgi:Fe-Mn family superoxide dismutase